MTCNQIISFSVRYFITRLASCMLQPPRRTSVICRMTSIFWVPPLSSRTPKQMLRLQEKFPPDIHTQKDLPDSMSHRALRIRASVPNQSRSQTLQLIHSTSRLKLQTFKPNRAPYTPNLPKIPPSNLCEAQVPANST